jgi:hypothetical protein
MRPGAVWTQPRRDYVIAALVAMLAFLAYALTVQPTVSFWDCGEFIACAATLGIPHPPGAPLFVLVGRCFALLHTAGDIGLRINLVSVAFGALSVGLGYLLLARLLRRWIFAGPGAWGTEWLIAMSACVGTVLGGFGLTVWSNAVEAEVYGITLFLFLVVVHATVAWIDRRDTPAGPRLLIFATFAATLGMGAHMMVFLAVPALWLSVALWQKPYRSDPVLAMAAFATLLVTFTGVEAYVWNLFFVAALGLLYALLQRFGGSRFLLASVPALVLGLFSLFAWLLPLREPLFPAETTGKPVADWFGAFHWASFDWAATVIVLVLALIAAWRASRRSETEDRWSLATGLAVASLVAFSLHLYIPVRSRLNPAIDENNPESWVDFKGFLERKQYGRESMVSRMFHRRGTWSHQLGRHPRMGFWSFFEKQYGLKSGPVDVADPERGAYLPPAFLLLFALGIFGVGYLAAVFRRVGLPFLVTLLLTTVGLVAYMNFADGTRYNPRAIDQAYLEVRDRDYFFTTGFALFGLSVGLGVGAFMRLFADPKSKRLWPGIVIMSSAVFLFALPLKTLRTNWWYSDRSRDFIPFDYAYNILASCDPNSILFTNGDNDTFPVWCLQEAYGIRRDVSLINLSLANTFWYIRQVKNQMGVAFDLPDAEIDRLRFSPERGRIQDQVIDIVLTSNRWERPVHFGTSVPEGSRVFDGVSLDSNLVIVGVTMKLVRERRGLDVDRDLTMKRYREDFQFRGLSDTTIYKSEATRRIADNYATGLLFVADAYRKEGLIDSAVMVVRFAARLRPELLNAYAYIAQLGGEYGRPGLLDTLLAFAPPWMRSDLCYNFGLAAELRGDSGWAPPAYRRALTLDSGNEAAFRRLAAGLYDRQSLDSLLALIDNWIQANPIDTVGPLLRRDVLLLMQRRSDPGAGGGQP